MEGRRSHARGAPGRQSCCPRGIRACASRASRTAEGEASAEAGELGASSKAVSWAVEGEAEAAEVRLEAGGAVGEATEGAWAEVGDSVAWAEQWASWEAEVEPAE